MRFATITAAVGLSTVLATASANAQVLKANAGVVAGISTIGPGFRCATSGPVIRDPWFAGVSIPLEGIATCGLGGMVDSTQGTSGTVTANATGSGPMAGGGTYTGTASARANFWNLGVAASGNATGGSSSTTFRESASFASFSDDVIFTSPTKANGTNGAVDFSFLIEGMMSNIPNSTFALQGDIYFSLFINGILWNAFIGTELNNSPPNLRGGSTNIPGNFVISPAMFSGKDSIRTAANFAMVFGQPLHVEIAMYTDVYPCCNGSSLVSDFSNSAKLNGISVFAGGNSVTDFLATGVYSGIKVNANGVINDVPPPTTTAPEPSTVALMFAGLSAVAFATRRRRNRTV